MKPRKKAAPMPPIPNEEFFGRLEAAILARDAGEATPASPAAPTNIETLSKQIAALTELVTSRLG